MATTIDKLVVNEPSDQEVIGNRKKEVKTKIEYTDAEFDQLQEEIEELKRQDLEVTVNVTGKIPK